MPRKAFRITRQNKEGEHLGIPNTNACRCCYAPLPDKPTEPYCSPEHAEKHRRLRGAA